MEGKPTLFSGCFGENKQVSPLLKAVRNCPVALGGRQGVSFQVQRVLRSVKAGAGVSVAEGLGRYHVHVTQAPPLLWLWRRGLFFFIYSIIPPVPCPVGLELWTLDLLAVKDHPPSSDLH